MSWSAEIEDAFADLLDAVGEDVLWTDLDGIVRLNADGSVKQALFHRPGQLIESSAQISDEYAIEFRDQDFPGIATGHRVAIYDQAFRVRTVIKGDDHVLRTATLSLLDGTRA